MQRSVRVLLTLFVAIAAGMLGWDTVHLLFFLPRGLRTRGSRPMSLQLPQTFPVMLPRSRCAIINLCKRATFCL